MLVYQTLEGCCGIETEGSLCKFLIKEDRMSEKLELLSSGNTSEEEMKTNITPYRALRIELEEKDKQNLLHNNALVQLHNELNKLNKAQIEQWGSLVYCDGYYYQGYKRIGINGIKPSEERIEGYEIHSYFSKEKSVLDIGSNSGFMSCYLSEFVKEIDAIELNPYLSDMGVVTANFLNIKNINFLKNNFIEYDFIKKYDIVFSLSNHYTIDGNLNMGFEDYIKKIYNVMHDGGVLFFESHNINGDDSDMELKFKIASKYFTLVKYKMVRSFFPQDIDKLFSVFLREDNPRKTQIFDFNLEEAKYKYEY